jgi:hypothetical protein
MNADREHQPIGEMHRLADHIDMAVGDWIERSGKERNALAGSRWRFGHRRGLACVLNDRKRRRNADLGAAASKHA